MRLRFLFSLLLVLKFGRARTKQIYENQQTKQVKLQGLL